MDLAAEAEPSAFQADSWIIENEGFRTANFPWYFAVARLAKPKRGLQHVSLNASTRLYRLEKSLSMSGIGEGSSAKGVAVKTSLGAKLPNAKSFPRAAYVYQPYVDKVARYPADSARLFADMAFQGVSAPRASLDGARGTGFS